LIDKLSFLKGGSEGGSVSADEERLMQLFQNRAGLKKAYADLKDEFHILRDRLKQQEGATLRVQEQLDALGDLLADPATGFGALVFFQLRGLWKTCHQQLAKFATDLTRQQEARETARMQGRMRGHQEHAPRRRRGAAASGGGRGRRPSRASRGRSIRAVAAHRLLALLPPPPPQRALESLRQGVVVADAAVGELHAEKSAIVATRWLPSFPASPGARRNINLAIISYAESLVRARG
jgi:hypothetical protein